MNLPASRIAAAFVAACRDELEAPKPGNVHLFAPGHRMTAAQFEESAAAAAGPLARHGAGVGARILGAVEATRKAVGATNTNLGIVLLCAPLAAAAERPATDLRSALAGVLVDLDVEDAKLAFRAIVLANPAGLGRVKRHDVFAPAHVTLREAMAEAADRDRIAAQYDTDFVDVFERGEPLLRSTRERTNDPRWGTLAVFLGFLSAFPDSHVVRKHGPTVAEEVRRRAVALLERLCGGEVPPDLATITGELLEWDRELKNREINPGTSADLTVATLFVHRLTEHLAVGAQE